MYCFARSVIRLLVATLRAGSLTDQSVFVKSLLHATPLLFIVVFLAFSTLRAISSFGEGVLSNTPRDNIGSQEGIIDTQNEAAYPTEFYQTDCPVVYVFAYEYLSCGVDACFGSV